MFFLFMFNISRTISLFLYVENSEEQHILGINQILFTYVVFRKSLLSFFLCRQYFTLTHNILYFYPHCRPMDCYLEDASVIVDYYVIVKGILRAWERIRIQPLFIYLYTHVYENIVCSRRTYMSYLLNWVKLVPLDIE